MHNYMHSTSLIYYGTLAITGIKENVGHSRDILVHELLCLDDTDYPMEKT
jgi:hypothetical protein